MRALTLALLVGCGGASAAPQTTQPTDIGASDALRAEEARLAEGPIGAALASMPEADLTTSEGLEVLGFSAASVFAMATFTLALQAHAEEGSGDCIVIERSETGEGVRAVVLADECESGSAGQIVDGELVVESREEECGEWVGLTIRPWAIRDPRTCGSTDHPKGTRIFEGRIVSNECAGTISIELRVSGDGWEERKGQCEPMRETVMRYELRHGGDSLEGGTPLNGHGEVGLEGVGRARVETVDEVLGRQDCNSEAESGLTRASAGGHVAEVTYDGATDCTDPGSAPYTLDGQPAGTTEHACAAGGAPSGSAFALLACLALLRRRRR